MAAAMASSPTTGVPKKSTNARGDVAFDGGASSLPCCSMLEPLLLVWYSGMWASARPRRAHRAPHAGKLTAHAAAPEALSRANARRAQYEG
eukprot:CAMPEP_0171881564 /NCGR_PEP_ID=MMETSP0992-20121227/39089_1 /TAXON_ID=483369 /ORGANISM="non described non described, Strain CCMP2098" /LENGTH=90 /DNA_ID=CAMNT_0012507473 /DNA_START=122 /DNA_END=394 /DNA_ORIENTATION=+